jgi:hypothetical protein
LRLTLVIQIAIKMRTGTAREMVSSISPNSPQTRRLTSGPAGA